MQHEPYPDGQCDPKVGVIRAVIRESLSRHNDRGKAAYDAVREARKLGASDAQLTQAIEDTGLRDD
jgi:hypothetical protein